LQVSWLGSLALHVFDRFARAAISVGHLRIVLPNGAELSYGDPSTAQPPVASGRRLGTFSSILLPCHSRHLVLHPGVPQTWLAVPSGVRLAVAPADSSPLCVPPGEEWRQRPRQAAVIRLFSYAFFSKIIMRHDTGMGESYMDGDYEVIPSDPGFNLGYLYIDRTPNCLHTTDDMRTGSDRLIGAGAGSYAKRT
jgi:hypothetical protein